MKVGDYVRTINGEIYKLIDDFALIYFQKEQEHGIPEHQIIKSSPNIIDLIEEGDYVNGHKVIYTIGNIHKRIYVEYVNMDELLEIELEQIKSIVTEEQFESMKYEVK